ncbi:MAG TPA: hypothetical protein VF622_10440 [Segetibacter sp.]
MKQQNSNFKLIPFAGITIFILLYIVAAIVYPGGNHLDEYSEGFSILHNYWCDLLNSEAQNGEINTSRPFAVTAMIILCTSLMVFWYYLPKAFNIGTLYKATISISGIASMIIGMFIFTSYHGEAITYSGFFGGIAFIATFFGLYKSKWYKLFWLGILCLVLGAITFAIYKTREGLIILPMIQKVTLLLCLMWIAIIDVQMKRKTE